MNEKEHRHPSNSASRGPTADRLLTIREVAELTGLSVGGLYHLVSQRRIPVIRLSRRCIRFRQSALHAWWDGLSQVVLKGAEKRGSTT